MRVILVATFLIALFPLAAADAATHRRVAHASSPPAPALTLESINAAAPQGTRSERALILKTEVLLDRDGFSPGEIDGKNGDNFRKALAAFQQAKNLAVSGKLDADTWNALVSDNTDPPAHIVHDLAERRGWPI
jgi:peptidoglycan hydrolase-like protein with peptidoglycan-binding domain